MHIDEFETSSAADKFRLHNETVGTIGMGLSYLDKLDDIAGSVVESMQTKSLQMEVETFLAANLSGKDSDVKHAFTPCIHTVLVS